MINVEEAFSLLNSSEILKRKKSVNLDDALNFTLAKDILSPINIPSFLQSAMDGYAVCGKHKKFEVIDEIQAGDTRNISLEDKQAVRIFTGAPVPKEATAVIMQEKTEREIEYVLINDDIVDNKNIRLIGGQIKTNDLVFKKGQLLNASALGLLQTLGVETVAVYDAPKISLIVTGDELKPLGTTLKNGEIYESNSITIMSAIKQCGYKIDSFNHVKDDYESTKNAISDEISKTDVLLISGGISVGDYDFVYDALTENNVEKVFYKIKQKPGKPLFFGKKGHKYVFALPGNPAAALTCFYMYVVPLLHKIAGKTKIGLKKNKAQLQKTLTNKSGRALFLKGYYHNEKVEVLDGQSSAMLHSFALANCLIFMPENKSTVNEGESVTVFELPQ